MLFILFRFPTSTRRRGPQFGAVGKWKLGCWEYRTLYRPKDIEVGSYQYDIHEIDYIVLYYSLIVRAIKHRVVFIPYLYYSFGRHISHDEDGLSVSGFTSDGEDEDAPPKTQSLKKKAKWGKAMNKTKDPKTPNSFQTLAGVSMMMLQPITAGAGSTSTPDLVSFLFYLNIV